MARIVEGRVLPTFFPTSPTNERESTWDKLLKEGINIQRRMDDNLQKATDLLFSYMSLQKKNRSHDVSAGEVAENIYDEFGREGDGPIDNKPVCDNILDEVHASSETEILQGEEDIPIHTTPPVREISHGACEGHVEDIGMGQVDSTIEYGHLHEGLDHGSNLAATYQLDVLGRPPTGAASMLHNSPLQEYIDRACGTMSSQWYSGEWVRYEDKGVDSSRLCLQDQQQFCFGSSRLVSAAACAVVARLQQQVGLFYRYTWDPGITWPGSWTVGSTGRLHEAPCAGVLQSSMGCSWHSIVRRIVWDPGILQRSIPSTECYQFPRLTWDPGINIGSVGSCLEQITIA